MNTLILSCDCTPASFLLEKLSRIFMQRRQATVILPQSDSVKQRSRPVDVLKVQFKGAGD